ncbi:MAG: hypothetical protein NTZ95_01655 [Candidatus Omnitrophica bacterium]|nr:hypothetical protein [Candidatus Omnitrophota bacterium]
MNKPVVLRVVNTVLFFSFILQAITIAIIILKIRLPHMQLVFEVHEYNGLFMIIVAAIHITLNWGWIKASFFKKQ